MEGGESVAGYTTYSDLRGCCGHRHKTWETAHQCLEVDNRRCYPYGYSDRKVYAVNEDGIILHGERSGMLVRLGRERVRNA
jgi:hypothetical protein